MRSAGCRAVRGRLKAICTVAIPSSAALVAAGCATEPMADTIEVAGDTTVVVSRSPAAWGAERTAHFDLVLGSPDASDEYVFGRLEPLAPTPDAGVVVYDQMYNRISRFGADGSFMGFIGQGGQGPGEYDAVVDLAVTSTGVIAVQLYDGRILLYDTDGTYRTEWRTQHRFAIGRSLATSRDSLLVLRLARPAHRFIAMTLDGEVVDLLDLPATPWDDEVGRGQADIAPGRFDIWSPSHFGIAAVGSRLAFQVVDSTGSVRRVERDDYPRVGLLPSERADWEAQNEFLRRRAGAPDRFPPVPDFKPTIRGVFAAPGGDVWVHVATESSGPDPGHVESVAGLRATPQWLEPLRMEVFTRQGDYLGRVVGPPGVDVRAVSHGVIWGYRNGEFGEQHIVRLRVDDPS